MMHNKNKKLHYIGLISFGLLLAGISWYFDSDSLDQLLLPWAIISMGSGCILMGFYGLRYGRVYSRSGYVYRDEQPFHFWLLVVLCQAGGWTMLVFGVSHLFGFGILS